MFLISHKYKFIFFHIPRTGGTSVGEVLRSKANFIYRFNPLYDFTCKYLHERPFLYLFQSHTTAKNVKKKISLEIYTSYKKFAVCRNPYDWALSVYFYTKKAIKEKTNHFKELHGVVENCSSFDDFCQWLKDNGGGFQKNFVTDENGNLIVDYILRFENLNDDFISVMNDLGIDCILQKLNSSRDGNEYLSYYNESTKKIIYATFKEDFDFFGYKE